MNVMLKEVLKMKDSKAIYELLNEVDFNIENYEKEDLSDIEKQKLKKSFRKNTKKKFNVKRFGAIAAAIVLSVGVLSRTNFGKKAFAATQSKISEISYSIGKALNIEKNIEPYANVVNQVVENNGIGVKLSDVIIDKDELIFSTILETNEPVDEFRFNYDIFINGKRLNFYSASGSSQGINNSKTLFVNTYSTEAKDIELTKNMDIKIVLRDFNYYIWDSQGNTIQEENVQENWEFEFTANGKELMANTYQVPLNYSFKIDNQQCTLEEFRYNPVNQKIYAKIKGESEDVYDIKLMGHDNLENEVNFYLIRKSEENLVFKYLSLNNDLSDKITSITLTPYAAKFPRESGRMSNDYNQIGEEFTIYLK